MRCIVNLHRCQPACQPAVLHQSSTLIESSELIQPFCCAAATSPQEPATSASPAASAAASALVAALDSDDPDMRAGALAALLQLSRHPAGWETVRALPSLGTKLATLRATHLALEPEDREIDEEEVSAAAALETGVLAPSAAAPAVPEPLHDDIDPEGYDAAFSGQQQSLDLSAIRSEEPGGAAVAPAQQQQPAQQQGAPFQQSYPQMGLVPVPPLDPR